MKALVCHPGTQHSARLAGSLQERDLLQCFYTGWRSPVLARFLRTTGNRTLSPRLRPLTRQIRLPEFLGKILQTLGVRGSWLYRWRNLLFQRLIPDRTLRIADAVIGFDTASWDLLLRAHACGTPFVLDRTAVHRNTQVRLRSRHGLSSEEGKAGDWQATLEASELTSADAIVVASDFARQSLVEAGVAPEKITIIPYGVDLTCFTPKSTDGGGEESITFLFVGNLVAEKGIETLLSAWQSIPQGKARLWLVGPGSREVAARAEALPGVTVYGKLDAERLRKIYQAATVFVFPTLLDGFGLVLLEAMASGLAVLATPNCAAPDLLASHGGGELCPAGDIPAWREALGKIIANPAEWAAKGRAARRSAEEFTWEKYGARWEKLLQGLH